MNDFITAAAEQLESRITAKRDAEALYGTLVSDGPGGAWYERVGDDGRPISTFVVADSTLVYRFIGLRSADLA